MSSSEPSKLDTDNPNTQQVLPGVAFKWIEQNRVVICRLRDNTRMAVDVFSLTFASILRERVRDRSFLVLFDLGKLDLSLTAYFREKLVKIVDEHPDLHGRAAWLVKSDYFARAAQLLVTRQLPVYNPNFEQRVFKERDVAVAWLKEKLEPSADPPKTDS